MKVLSILIFLMISLNPAARAQGSEEFLFWTKEPDDDCELKKLISSNQWQKIDPETIEDEPIRIEKEYESGSVTFKIANDWYGTQRKCLESVPNLYELHNATRGIFTFGYQRNIFDGEGAAPNGRIERVDDVWVGLITGITHEYYRPSGFRLHDGIDLELGQSIMKRDQHLSVGVRGFGGAGFAFTDRVIISAEAGLLLRYGDFPIGSNFILSFQAGLNEEYRITPKQSIRLSQGTFFTNPSFYFSIGVVTDIQ